MIPVFLGCDTMSEWTSEDESQHVIERRCRLNVDAPYILKKVDTINVQSLDAGTDTYMYILYVSSKLIFDHITFVKKDFFL